MIQFYAPEIESTLLLPESESAHCCRVLRMKEGDEVVVTDGRLHRFLCEIEKAHPSQTKVRIKEKINVKPERDYSITLAVAPTKNSDRLEWLAEKAVEIGIDTLVLLKCQRSERKIQRADRLRKIMISAMNQSLSAKLPELVDIKDIRDFIKGEETTGGKFFGYCSREFPRKELVKEYKPGENVVIMIGPEGDFTPEEVDLAVKKGFVPVTFGEKRLRTETAGVFALSAVNIINQMQ